MTPQSSDGDRYLTLAEFLDFARIGRRTYYDLVEAGEAPQGFVRLGRRKLGIRRRDAAAWIESRAIKPKAPAAG